LNRSAGARPDDVDAPRWQREVEEVAASDTLNPYLSGLACSILLEQGRIAEEELAREVSRRLSPGIEAERGAGWFEGLVKGNRQALFSRMALWRQVDTFIPRLSGDEVWPGRVDFREACGHVAAGGVCRVLAHER